MKNSGNYAYDYAKSFFGENCQSNALYWFIIHTCEILYVYRMNNIIQAISLYLLAK